MWLNYFEFWEEPASYIMSLFSLHIHTLVFGLCPTEEHLI